MSERFTEEEVVTTVTRLTRSQLVRFIDVDLVKPERSEGGYVFRRIDIARLELLCDLSQDLELDEPVIGLIISLIDQLHGARQDLAVIADAIEALPPEVQAKIAEAAKRA